VCPACAAPLEAETLTVHEQPPASASSSAEEGRFPAGTVLAGRYRILGLLGHGGMGEVYRAYDLILSQSVALKFLPQAKVSEAALARFRNEVRIARQVSHPNVCRVYDIGFVEGLQFLSMEYLDGEDLASLLRRIGRLPQDKALEFARKICAGLAAAHERGVLHRDLKPANVMIDGRGQVRITDFGLAALASDIPLSDVGSGTPAYLSPEQKAGKEVTTRSDLYALGLVLHEMFTGSRRKDFASRPGELVKDLDPAIERVILRCLEEDPKRRPSSALNVAMALPGGDPIAAALAAGETPSPEMVAASREKEGFKPRTAWLACAATLILLAAISTLQGRLSLPARARLEIPPDALAFRAQTVLQQLGYRGRPADSAYGFDFPEADFLQSVRGTDAAARDRLLAAHQPAVIRFWYRQHQSTLLADSFLVGSPLPPVTPLFGVLTYASPANTEPGMVRLALNANGALVELEVRPSSADSSGVPATVDWSALFAAAGLDPARFSPAEPQSVPPMAFDARAAWTGTFAEGRTEQVRLEAAAWHGRPVFLSTSGDWRRQETPAPAVPAYAYFALFSAGLLLLLAGASLAWRNLRLGRGDRRGATWSAGVVFVMALGSWALVADHVRDPWELTLFTKALCFATFISAAVATVYLAVEPYARRYWPDALISLTRLQAGRLKDSLVASHILGAIAITLATAALTLVAQWTVAGADAIHRPRIDALNGPAYAVSLLLFDAARSMGGTLAVLVLLVLLRLLVRRMWLADVLGAFLAGSLVSGVQAWVYPTAGLLPALVLGMYVKLILLRRCGVLALMVSVFIEFQLSLPLAVGSWYAGQSILLLAIPAGVSLWALWTILAAEPRASAGSAEA
jgi:hypothetical protein